MPSEPAKAAEGIGAETAKAVDAAKTTAKEVTEQATAQVKAAQDQAQGLIEKAKAFVADKKYQDALASLNQLAGSKLTPDQQTLVDGLKAQIQAALAKAAGTGTNAAASALGGVLGGKK